MYVLGISGGFSTGYQDVCAVLLKDGEIVAAVEEERCTRIKFSAGKLPYFSILKVLKIGGIAITDVSIVAMHGIAWSSDVEAKVSAYFLANFGYCPTIMRFHHHDCHAASTYYARGWDAAAVVTIDGSGDGVSLQISSGKDGRLHTLYRSERPHSLGIFYSLVTQYCGFTKDADEYKLMGLSSYGNRNAYNFDWLIDIIDGELVMNTSYLIDFVPNMPAPHRDEMLFNQKFIEKMGVPRRLPGTKMTDYYKDVSASAQLHFEKLLNKIIDKAIQLTGSQHICMAGGSALNCVANQSVLERNEIYDVYIQPAANDAGVALGAAWLACVTQGIKPIATHHTYWGNSFDDDTIENILQTCHIPYLRPDDIVEVASQLICEGKVIGWFQGRMEYGPRALGNRSILANPCDGDMQDIVNRKIKLRESFRPFCPSVLDEDSHLFFCIKNNVSPYMTVTYRATDYAYKTIPAVVHVDGTARIQIVNKQENELYYKLLQNVKDKIGHGVLLNTSFNLSHEPMVCTPRDALATFYSSGLDALCMGSFLVLK